MTNHVTTPTASTEIGILQYETALTSSKFVLIAYGSMDAAAEAKGFLKMTNPEVLHHHK